MPGSRNIAPRDIEDWDVPRRAAAAPAVPAPARAGASRMPAVVGGVVLAAFAAMAAASAWVKLHVPEPAAAVLSAEPRPAAPAEDPVRGESFPPAVPSAEAAAPVPPRSWGPVETGPAVPPEMEPVYGDDAASADPVPQVRGGAPAVASPAAGTCPLPPA